MKQIQKKLRSRRGMSLTEVLVAMLILGLVTLGAAVGVNSSMNVYRQSVSLSDSRMLSSTLATALMDELRYAREPQTVTTGEGVSVVTFTSRNFGVGVSVSTDASGQPGHVTVGDRLLVGTGAYAGHLKAEAQVDYQNGIFSVELSISDGGTVVCAEEFSVRPLNGGY